MEHPVFICHPLDAPAPTAERRMTMKTHDATEQAYKNGYQKGFEDGVKEFAERLRKVASRGFWETRDYVEVDQIDDLEYDMVVADMRGEKDD
jgi:hypothetical protein